MSTDLFSFADTITAVVPILLAIGCILSVLACHLPQVKARRRNLPVSNADSISNERAEGHQFDPFSGRFSGLRARARCAFSLLEIMVVVVVVGILAALAIPAFNKSRVRSQDQAVLANLRQISSGAAQYMMSEGANVATLANIMGPGLQFSGLASVADETYDFTILTNTTRLSTMVTGRVVSYDF